MYLRLTIQMAILGSSDAINSMGIDWDQVMTKVKPDEVAVYATSGLGQADEYGMGGYLQARLRSNRPTSKQVALLLVLVPLFFIIYALLLMILRKGVIGLSFVAQVKHQ